MIQFIDKIKNIDEKKVEKITYINFIIIMLLPFISLLVGKFKLEYKNLVWEDLASVTGFISFLVGLFYLIRKKEYKKFRIIFIFLIWALICSLCSKDIYLAILGNDYRNEGLYTYFLYFGIFLCSFYFNRDKILSLMKIFAICGFLTVLLQSMISFQLFYQFNHYGYYIMLTLITTIFLFIMESSNKKIIYFLMYIYLLYSLVINDTFGSFLAIFVTVILYFIYAIFLKKMNFKIILILISFVLISFSIKKDGKFIEFYNFTTFKNDVKIVANYKNEEELAQIGTNRGELWTNGIKFVLKSPILGYGIEGAEVLYKSVGISMDRPHNILIQMALFTGIPGCILYIYFIGKLFIQNLLKIKKLSQIEISICFICGCYLISSQFGNSMFYTTPYYIIFLGFMMKNLYLKEKSL